MTSILFEDVISNYAHSTTLFCLYEKGKKDSWSDEWAMGTILMTRETDRQINRRIDRQTNKIEKNVIKR